MLIASRAWRGGMRVSYAPRGPVLGIGKKVRGSGVGGSGESPTIVTPLESDTSWLERLLTTKTGATIVPAATVTFGSRSSSCTSGMGSPAANVIQPAAASVGDGDDGADCGREGKCCVPLANRHSMGGSAVGVGNGDCAAAAVGPGAGGRGSTGTAGVAVRLREPAGGGMSVGAARDAVGVAAGRAGSAAAVGVAACCAVSGVGVCHAAAAGVPRTAGPGDICNATGAAFGPQAAASAIHVATSTGRRGHMFMKRAPRCRRSRQHAWACCTAAINGRMHHRESRSASRIAEARRP